MADPEEIPMRERNPPPDDNDQENGTRETNVDDKDRERDRERLRNLTDPDRSTNRQDNDRDADVSVNVADEVDPNFNAELWLDNIIDSDYDDIERRRLATNRQKLTLLNNLEKREEILEKVFSTENSRVRFRGMYGQNSKKLLRSLRLTRGKNGDVTGLEFSDPDGQ